MSKDCGAIGVDASSLMMRLRCGVPPATMIMGVFEPGHAYARPYKRSESPFNALRPTVLDIDGHLLFDAEPWASHQ